MALGFTPLAAMKRSPRDGWNLEQLKLVCRGAGIHAFVPPRGRHVVFSHPWVEGLLTVPADRRIKPIYVQLVVELVEAVTAMKK